MDPLRSAWEDLHARTDATMFQSFAWNRLAAEQFAQREAPYVVFAESDAGMAIIPAAVAHGHLRFLGEFLFDYRDVLFAGDREILHHAWAKLAALRLPLSVTALRGAGARELWSDLSPDFFCYALGVGRADLSAEQFASQHSRLGRYRRRLERQEVQLRHYNGLASNLVASIYGQKAEQFAADENNIFGDVSRIDFMMRAAAMQPDHCDVFTFESLGTIIAGLITFRDRSVRRFYTVYFNPAFAASSPGTVLLYEVTRQTLAAGLDCDYMTGEQPHKKRFATSRVPLFRVEASADVVARAARRVELISGPAA